MDDKYSKNKTSKTLKAIKQELSNIDMISNKKKRKTYDYYKNLIFDIDSDVQRLMDSDKLISKWRTVWKDLPLN